jgi:hypothetical protein
VSQLLLLAREGNGVDLPDPHSNLPCLKLFSLVTLNPKAVQGRRIPILHQPPLSILTNNDFVPPPPDTPPDSPNVARIFDVLALVSADPQLNEASIPLTNKDPDFEQQRYWRLPVKCEAVLAALFQRLPLGSYTGDCQEIHYSLHIRDILSLHSRVEMVIIPDLYFPQDGGGEPGDGDAPGGAGQSGGGSGPSGCGTKRRRRGNSTEPTRQSPRKKTETGAGGDTAREARESLFNVASGRLFCA